MKPAWVYWKASDSGLLGTIMQPTPIKYYVFHFKVKRVHYKDRSPNGVKLAVVTLYFGVLSLPRVGLLR
jgi:hypothetical protein